MKIKPSDLADFFTGLPRWWDAQMQLAAAFRCRLAALVADPFVAHARADVCDAHEDRRRALSYIGATANGS